MVTPIIEVCANSAASCVAAEQGGAARIELCAGIPEGGTTPSYGEMVTARRAIGIQLNVIIRPRGGDFLYTPAEVQTMLLDIEAAKAEIKSIENCSDRTVEELKTRIADLGRKLSEASPWGEFDRERLEKFSVRFYTVSKKQFDPAWKQVYPIEVINEDKYTVWFVTAGTGDTVPATQVPIPEKTPSGYRAEIDALTSEMKAHISALEARKPELPALRKKIESMYSDLSTYLAGVTAETAADGSLVIFEGFAPTEDGQKLKKALDGMDVYYIAQDATVEDNPPIKIHNNAYVSQFEPLTSMYGMPVYNEFDPRCS